VGARCRTAAAAFTIGHEAHCRSFPTWGTHYQRRAKMERRAEAMNMVIAYDGPSTTKKSTSGRQRRIEERHGDSGLTAVAECLVR
jgi:hypothetical protein